MFGALAKGMDDLGLPLFGLWGSTYDGLTFATLSEKIKNMESPKWYSLASSSTTQPATTGGLFGQPSNSFGSSNTGFGQRNTSGGFGSLPSISPASQTAVQHTCSLKTLTNSALEEASKDIKGLEMNDYLPESERQQAAPSQS